MRAVPIVDHNGFHCRATRSIKRLNALILVKYRGYSRGVTSLSYHAMPRNVKRNNGVSSFSYDTARIVTMWKVELNDINNEWKD